MFSVTLVIAIIAFLGGAATATFLVLSIGIRKGDRPRCRPDYPGSPVDSFTRVTLRTGTWPHSSVAFGDSQED
jgi:hypothetical protein